jgi:hypothetical protein
VVEARFFRKRKRKRVRSNPVIRSDRPEAAERAGSWAITESGAGLVPVQLATDRCKSGATVIGRIPINRQEKASTIIGPVIDHGGS